MENTQTYERIIKQACVGRVLSTRILAYIGYAVFALIWLPFIIASLFQPLLIVLSVLLTVILVVLTRKYLHVEFEYTFVSGELTVSKIYGKKKRKALFCAELRDAVLIAPATDDYVDKIEGKVISALSAPTVEDALLLVFDEGKSQRVTLLIESDERTVTLCRRASPAACAKELRRNI